MFNFLDPSIAPLTPFAEEVLDSVVGSLPAEVRSFARYWLPVAVWASVWSMEGRAFRIVVSVSDRALVTSDVLDGTVAAYEEDRCGPREVRRPRPTWSQSFRNDRVGSWVLCDERVAGPVLHIFVPPCLPAGGFWARVLTTSGGDGENRDLVFGPFSGDEAPRDYFAWMEGGGYGHLLIRAGVEPGAAVEALPPTLRVA